MLHIKQKRWFVPLILISVLLFIWVFRWNVEASKTYDDVIVKYVRDRWTGEVWLRVYTIQKYVEIPAKKRIPERNLVVKKRNIATGVWSGLFTINIVWLFLIMKTSSKAKHCMTNEEFDALLFDDKEEATD